MKSKRKATTISISLCTIACFISPYAVRAQQAVSSQFGAHSSSSGSKAGTSVSAGVAGSGGGSAWGAGKGNFGSTAQPGGVWRDGSTFSAAPTPAKVATQDRTPIANVSAPGGGAATESFSKKSVGGRESTESGSGHLSRSSLGRSSGGSSFGRGAAFKSSSMKSATGSHSRVTSFSHGTGNFGHSTGSFGHSTDNVGHGTGNVGHGLGNKEGTRPSTGLPSMLTPRTRTRGSSADSFPRTELETGLTKSDARALP
jgi:hypothetical protein